MSVWKETYNGQGIYWHGRDGYGDETRVLGRTVADVRAIIDARIAAALAERAAQPHLAYWDALPHEDRRKWRQLSATTELSASELAYTNRPFPRD